MAITSYMKEGKKLFLVEIKTRDRSGKQIYRSRQGITSERKALDAEFELRKEVELVVNKKPGTAWKAWFNEALNRMRHELRPSTVINYEAVLNKWATPLWSAKDIREITRTDVQELIYEVYPADNSMHSRKTLFKMVKRILQMACEEGLLDRNPTMGMSVKVPDVDQKVLANSEVEIFLKEAKLTNHRFFPIWFVALKTGMRSGELFGLTWSDVDFEGRMITVSKQWTNKNGFTPTKTMRSRVVPISEDLLKFLKKWKLQCDLNNQFVLPHLKEWENGEQARVTAEFCASIGITQVKFHDLRATFITNLLSRGVSLARVMSMVGHSQLKTTNGYLRKAGVEVKGATDQLGYQLPDDIDGQVLAFKQLNKR